VIDVFIRTTNGQGKFREALFEATYQRWLMEPEVNIRTLRDMGIREARQCAEVSSRSDPYIFTDNDVLIVGKRWVERGTEAMLANPEYAVCSTLSLIEGENLAKPPEGSGSIYPVHSVGAPMWIRKNILTDLPEMDMNMECGILWEYVKAKGYKEGLIAGLRHNHMGHGFSSNPSLCYGV